MKASTVNKELKLAIRDVLIAPFTLVAVVILRVQRKFVPLKSAPLARAIFRRIGVFPLRDHYYEPAFLAATGDALGPARDLPGIDFRVSHQIALLQQFDVSSELRRFPETRPADDASTYYYDNGWFESGDAECLYAVLRHFKPRRMIEIGSGFSTLIAAAALRENRAEDCPSVHTCIEPYSNRWLEEITDLSVLRSRVEEVGSELFHELGSGDVLFIDSSHMIRPGGDVLFEYLQVLPSLNEGVLVHIHDIFTPYDYPRKWIAEEGRFWNEQYLVEAFLSFNTQFEILLALNMLARQRPREFASTFPVYAAQGEARALGSLWLRRVSTGGTG